MKQIGLAFRSWSLDNNGHFPMQVSVTGGGTMELVTSGAVHPHFEVMSNELSTAKILLCPDDQKRYCATNFTSDLTDGKLSYFINVDAINGDAYSLLSGDRNLTNRASAGSRLVRLTNPANIAWTKEIHSQKGHLAFADGNVESFSNGAVSTAIKIAAGITNRLAVP
jgi:prepilin-type processing-associated H-X9-DG protein